MCTQLVCKRVFLQVLLCVLSQFLLYPFLTKNLKMILLPSGSFSEWVCKLKFSIVFYWNIFLLQFIKENKNIVSVKCNRVKWNIMRCAFMWKRREYLQHSHPKTWGLLLTHILLKLGTGLYNVCITLLPYGHNGHCPFG